MITFIAPKLKETFFKTFDNKIFIRVPISIIFLSKHLCKCFLRGPFNSNPFQGLSIVLAVYTHRWWHLELNWKFSIYIIFNLSNTCIRSKITIIHLLRIYLLLKPISDFKYISLLKLFICLIATKVLITHLWFLL